MSLFVSRLTSKLSSGQFRLNSYYQFITCYKNLRQLNSFSSLGLRTRNLIQLLSENKFQPFIRSISTSQEISLFTNKLSDNFVEQKRYKKGKKGSKREVKDDSDEESDAEEQPVDEYDPDLIDGKAIGFQDVEATLISLRLDNVMKSGLSIARHKVDEAFYNNLIRVNGQRVSKKSTELMEDDEIDFIKGLNQENRDLIDVSRVVIKKIADKMSSKDRIRAKLRKFKNLTIENYPNDPYDGFNINMKKEETTETNN